MASADSSRVTPVVGLLCGLGAYGFWGVAPLFWRFLHDVPAPELLAHRLVWACVCFVGVLAIRGRLGELRDLVPRGGTQRLRLVLSAAAVASNWFVFVYAILVDRLLDASLG